MPRRCVVPGCKSNYDTSLKTEPAVSTFTFPKSEERKKCWLRAIPRKCWTPTSSSAVCIKHFDKKHVITHQIYKNSEGKVQELLLERPRLTDDAIPSIFINLI